MALIPEHTKYHTLGPKDISWQGTKVSTFAVTRQSSAFGEQVSIECPIYDGDTRENMMKRVHMCYSILQERMEDENKVTLELEEKAKTRRREMVLREEAKKRNEARFEADKKELRRKAHKEKWAGEKIDDELKKLAAKFDEAQALIDKNPIQAPVVNIQATDGSEVGSQAQGV